MTTEAYFPMILYKKVHELTAWELRLEPETKNSIKSIKSNHNERYELVPYLWCNK